MRVSIEVPVFKGEYLEPCIRSVLGQISDEWHLSLRWDGGDDLSRNILEQYQGDPRISVTFSENRGIAKTRKALSDGTRSEFILPLDDDDMLAPNAVQVFLEHADAHPSASLYRARRRFIDQDGQDIGPDSWFPFAPRQYFRGMPTDLFNQAQPYFIRRSFYDQTQGWRGFADFAQAGEDCDIFLQLEEKSHFELIPEDLYFYRVHDTRASEMLSMSAGFEMWRRLADRAIERLGLPLARLNQEPPFEYAPLPESPLSLAHLGIVTCDGPGALTELQAAGFSAKNLHHVPDGPDWRMAGYRASTAPLVLFIQNARDLTPHALRPLVSLLNAQALDLVVPCLGKASRTNRALPLFDALDGPFLLARRRVLEALNLFDQEHVDPALQDVDFVIKAARRDFKWAEVGPANDGLPIEHRKQLRRKWVSSQVLLRGL